MWGCVECVCGYSLRINRDDSFKSNGKIIVIISTKFIYSHFTTLFGTLNIIKRTPRGESISAQILNALSNKRLSGKKIYVE